MKNFMGVVFLVFAVIFLGCNKEELPDPLNEVEKQKLESQISGTNKASIVAGLYNDLVELSEQSINISNSEQIKAIPLYQKVFNSFDKSEINFAVLLDFILYDERCDGEVSSLSSLILWDIADKNFSSVTETLRKKNKLNNIDLIKLLLTMD
jgi:hypothetical protein